MTSIPEFYAGRSIFVTGGTGFMGKVLCEKLLRSCSSLKKIYLLVRSKKGQDGRTRIENMFKSQMFERLLSHQPDFMSKIEVIPGDIVEEHFGLSKEDEQKLIDEVSIVFHSAATVKFDEALKLSIQMNVIGVKTLLEICKKMKKLEALVHVSTAYCNCDVQHITEAVYPAPQDPHKVLQAMDWMSNEVVETLSPHLVKPRPNTYTFTKALAEHLLVTECGDLPVAIVRPSIVGATWREPIPGWVDNYNGPTGIFIGIGKGVLRTMEGVTNATADIVPCDIAANMFIAAAWYTAIERPPVPKVFHCTTGQLNKLSWGLVERQSYENFIERPLDNPARLPNPGFTSSRIVRNIYMIMDHFFPAWLMDVYSKLVGKKAVYVRLQSRLWKSVHCLEFFTSNTWVFDSENYRMLLDKLSKEDRETFSFDVTRINWIDYLRDYCMGTKCYALKEDTDKMGVAKEKIKSLQRWEYIKNSLIVFIVWRILMRKVLLFRRFWFQLILLVVSTVRKVSTYLKLK